MHTMQPIAIAVTRSMACV